MKSWHLLVAGLAVVVGGVLALYTVFPQVTLEPARNYLRRQAKLEKKDVQVGDHRIVYLEGGRGDPLVLVHGFASNKDVWARFSRHVTSTQHVFALDLPGFGDSERKAPAEYTYESQVDRLDRFVSAVGISRFNLAGHSMGGAIAALYAAKHPDKVATLTLISPAGLGTSQKSELEIATERDPKAMEVHSVEDLDRYFSRMFVIPPEIPGIVKRGAVVEARASTPFYRAVSKVVFDRPRDFLTATLPKVRARTLVIWCDQDRALHPSGATVASDLLTNGKLLMLEHCGHVPQTERSLQTAQAVYDFIEDDGSDEKSSVEQQGQHAAAGDAH
jgi:pimeloyl-ACP methyl ester carboxylesterase